MDELIKMLEALIVDEGERQKVIDEIKKDRNGLESNKQQVLDELKTERASRKKLEGTVESLKGAFGDRTPEDVKAMMDRLENDELARLAAEGNTEKLLEKHKERWEADRKSSEAALQSQIDELTTERDKLNSELSKELIDNRAMAAATKAGVIPESLDVVKMLAKSQWKLEEGEPVLRDEKGEIVTGKKGALTFEEWATESLRETHSYLFPRPSGADLRGNNGNQGGKTNPWKSDSMNLTEQARIIREDPAKAERMKAEAGA
ncbi:hypothetical protein [Marinobacter sp. Hex_13]|uniref:hypothetical protein n=1 Tax=Marinobacter sp. Hex_13 TaxID=1795866 RepID=UPI0007978F65|nr:hypothetical protein [Marinobacter sp. Hex_13]KXJ45884.1 MAG: hypothetical protein AXW11_12405 [Marinobacter sp. Hex_13]